jgi:hypothetical protein
MDVSGLWGGRETRGIIHTTVELPGSRAARLKWQDAGSDVLLCGNVPRSPETILKTAICTTRGR